MNRNRRALDSLDDDIRSHIERETEENIARGLSAHEAHRQARLKFGNVALVREDTRAVWALPQLDQLRQDLRYALRMLRRGPGFSLVVIVTLALGIGANTAIFSLFEAIMLRTLAVQSPGDLFFVAHGAGSRAATGSNYPYFERIRARGDVFSGVTTYLAAAFRVDTGDGIEITPGQFVSGNYHAVVGVPMILGRGFGAASDRAGADALVVVISDDYWARRFGRDPQVLGRTLVVDGRALAIVGVTGPAFAGLDPGARPDITLPIAARALDAADFLTMQDTWLGSMPIVARLAPRVASTQAAAVVDAVFQQYLSEPRNAWLFKVPDRARIHASLIPAARGTWGLRTQYSTSLQVLLAMVGIVLLIGCANVANLLVARAAARSKEVAVRMSIGAGRWRLVRQFLTESMLLAVLGGALGFALARIGIAAIAALVGRGPNAVHLDLEPNATVLAFTVAISVLTGLLFGLTPALASTKVDLAPALKSGGAATNPPGRRWSTRQALLILQIASSVLLVSGAGLLGRTLRNLETRDGGFDRRNVLLFSLDLRGPSGRAGRLPQLCEDLIVRLSSRGDLTSGSCSRNIPVSTRGNARPLDVAGAPPQPLNARYVFTNMVSAEYFRTIGITVLAGRVFDARDTATAARVAVINRATARFFFADQDPIGRAAHFFNDANHPMTVVGVVEDTLQRSLRDAPPMAVYTPLAQLTEPEPVLTVALRARRNPLPLVASLRADVRSLDPEVVVDDIRTMEEQIGTTLGRERLVALLSGAFGGLGLVLSCVGLYGVISFDVTRSVRDLGIRMALGAQRSDIVGQVVRRALGLASIGVLAGLVTAVAATRLLSSLLFGVTQRDPLTLGAAAALLMLTTLIASGIPARRASRVDPVVVLRNE